MKSNHINYLKSLKPEHAEKLEYILSDISYYIIPSLTSHNKINKPTLIKSGYILMFIDHMVKSRSWCSFEDMSKLFNVNLNKLKNILDLLESNNYIIVTRDNIAHDIMHKYNSYKVIKHSLKSKKIDDFKIFKNVVKHYTSGINDIRLFDRIQSVFMDIKPIDYEEYFECIMEQKRIDRWLLKNSKCTVADYIKIYTDIYEFMGSWESLTPFERFMKVNPRGKRCGRYYDIFVMVPSKFRRYFDIQAPDSDKYYKVNREFDLSQSIMQVYAQLLFEFRAKTGNYTSNQFIDAVISGERICDRFKDDSDPSGKMNLNMVFQGRKNDRNFNRIEKEFGTETAKIFRYLKSDERKYTYYVLNGINIRLLKRGYGIISEIYQRYEAKIMDSIKMELRALGIVYKHVHDAIYTCNGDKDVIANVFKRNLAYYLPDVNAKFKITEI